MIIIIYVIYIFKHKPKILVKPFLKIFLDKDIIEPPCLRDCSDEELMNMIHKQVPAPNFSLHSQSVERAVKLTSGKNLNCNLLVNFKIDYQ